MDYNEWKENFELEFENHRNKNCKLIYSYESDYDYYANSDEWVMVGDSCNFVRRDALNKGQEITSKYEGLLLENPDVFRGFLIDEFERIRLWSNNSKEVQEIAQNIFKYNNMEVRCEDLSEEQSSIFDECVNEHLIQHEEDIEKRRAIFGDD